MPKFTVEVDAITSHPIRFTVDAKDVDEAQRIVLETDIWTDDPEDQEFLDGADELDIRYVINHDTQEVTQI